MTSDPDDALRATAHRRVPRRRQTVAHQPLGHQPHNPRPRRPPRMGREAGAYPTRPAHRQVDPLAAARRPSARWHSHLFQLLSRVGAFLQSAAKPATAWRKYVRRRSG